MSNPTPVWRRPDGTPVACVEKIKVMNENFTELRQTVQDLLDDAVLMGCSEAQVRDALHALIEGIASSYPEDTGGSQSDS